MMQLCQAADSQGTPICHYARAAAASDACCNWCAKLHMTRSAQRCSCVCGVIQLLSCDMCRKSTSLYNKSQNLPEVELVQSFIELPAGMLGVQCLEV